MGGREKKKIAFHPFLFFAAAYKHGHCVVAFRHDQQSHSTHIYTHICHVHLRVASRGGSLVQTVGSSHRVFQTLMLKTCRISLQHHQGACSQQRTAISSPTRQPRTCGAFRTSLKISAGPPLAVDSFSTKPFYQQLLVTSGEPHPLLQSRTGEMFLTTIFPRWEEGKCGGQN